MIADRRSMEYQTNLAELHEMEFSVPMTAPERTSIRKWVKAGHEIESNPWDLRDSDGCQLNYLQAFRLEYGYSFGPWDAWKGVPWMGIEDAVSE